MAARIIKDFDGKFLKRLQRALAGAPKKVVHVGFPKDGPAYEGGPSVATVAAFNEFGTSTIPERSFMRAGLKKGAKQQLSLNKANLKSVVRGEKSVDDALGELGALGAGQVYREISTGDFKPLDPKTIAARKRKRDPKYVKSLSKKAAKRGMSGSLTRPLIDEGDMLKSVTYEIPE